VSALLDTSVLSGPGPPPALDQDWAVSVISIGELSAGVLLAPDATTRAARLRSLTMLVEIAPALPIDTAVAQRFGELRAASGRRPSNDLWIAATALAHDLTLVTADRAQSTLPLVTAQLVS